MALVLKRALQAYGGNINEYGGLGIFKDLLTGKAVMEIKLEDGTVNRMKLRDYQKDIIKLSINKHIGV
jgi:hypothetical protein